MHNCRSRRNSGLAIFTLLIAASPLFGGDTAADKDFTWTQWNGPNGDGVSEETAWTPIGKEDNLWAADLGLGYSTVVVADGRLFTMGYDKLESLDIIWCFDAVTGEELWTHSYPAKIWNLAHEGGTVNTPVLDGDVLYSLNREGNLYCLDAKSGDVKWHNFLMPEENPHELEVQKWGFSASPLLLGNDMYLNCGRVLSIDKKTGKVLWISEDYGHGYGTPAAVEIEDVPALALLNGKGVGVISRKDGSQLYFREFAGKVRGINSATPVPVSGGLFVSSGTLDAGALLAYGESELEEVWANKEMVNSFSGCVMMDDYLYGYDREILKCVDLDGKTTWQVRGIGNGAVSGAAEMILAMGGTGELIIAEASPTEYKELSRVQLFDEGNYWTKPTLVNGIIYCRSSKGAFVARDHRVTKAE